jgi:hypothetical protein
MGIAAESALVPAGTDGSLAAAQEARALVVGRRTLATRRSRPGPHDARAPRAAAGGARPPRAAPGGTAPPAALTHFTRSGVRG